ncbi:MAG: hypothetical protein LBL39_02715 [Planctomycetaceae bacterium]|jgi:hypothetical protein|nr:hypothetical protein [Planctomycetaceae bacterium]
MDNPVQTECSTGLDSFLNWNYVVVQPKTFILAERVELLRSSLLDDVLTPCCTVVCTGLSMLKSYGLEISWANNIIIFILNFRERLQTTFVRL